MNSDNQSNQDNQLAKAIDTCAQEPIHIPGSIQPHGYLLIIDNDLKILKASENFVDICGVALEQLLGSSLSTFIKAESIATLKKLVVEGELNAIRYCTLSLESSFGPISCDAVLHQSGPWMIVELEPHQEDDLSLEHQDFYQELMNFSVQLHKIKSKDNLFNHVVKEVKRLTGFGRVMLYQFDEQWNGEVVAEENGQEYQSYLGLNFPASDIPEQARRLYSLNYLRLITDSNFTPVRILPDDKGPNGAPVDLSFSCLRSVSPVHLQYLRNMDVKASMSISVMQNDRLWGLIACHHDVPYRPAYPVRMAAELLAHTFSAFLSNYTKMQDSSEEKVRELQLRELDYAFTPDKPLFAAIESEHTLILNLLDADGIIVKFEQRCLSFGLTPETASAELLFDWVKQHTSVPVFATSSIVESTGLEAYKDSGISGAIVVPVSESPHHCVMFFRRETIREKNWAGKPEKKIARTETGFKLTPRASFERWSEAVTACSRPWSRDNVNMSTAITKLILAKHYEDSLYQATHNMETVVNNSTTLVYIINTTGTLMQMNESALKAFNLSRKNVIARQYTSVFDASLSAIIGDQLQQVISERKSCTFTNSFSYNDSMFHLVTVVFPLFDNWNQIHAICSIATDVSELYGIQEKLKSSNKELERVAFVACHDLQEPIRMISSFTKLLKADYGDRLDDQAADYIDFTLTAASRMSVLIQDLLEYARIENVDQMPPVIATGQVLDRLIGEMGLMNQLGDATITIADNMPNVAMKPEHFTCIMHNLLNNALKYCKKSEPARVNVQSLDDGAHWRISVSDNGIGIKQEYLTKIFDIFQRLHTKKDYAGTGIGLALCAKITEAHGGRAWAESSPGEGSTFHFTISKTPKNHAGLDTPPRESGLNKSKNERSTIK